MLLIYIEKNSPRLSYILDILLNRLIGIDYRIETDIDVFLLDNCPKLSYTTHPIPLHDGIAFIANPLLWENTIYNQPIKPLKYQEACGLFQVYQGDLPFDLFASAFYLISRYEEYLDSPKDKHGRFQALYSIAYKEGFLEKPMVNIYASILKKICLDKYPLLSVSSPLIYKAISTYDIDAPYQFLGKPLWRNILGGIYDLFCFKPKQTYQRSQVLTGRKPDPYDIFSYLDGIHKAYPQDVIYFFHLGDYQAPYDKNISYKNKSYQKLLKKSCRQYEVGIHPSYQSNYALSILDEEKNRLEQLAKRPIYKSRQHFLRVHLPNTYRALIDCGIQADFSMGYADQIGFRASTCTAFPFYDLKSEQTTSLEVFSPCLMDATFKYYLHIENTFDILDKIQCLINTCKKYKGVFIPIWHNDSFSNTLSNHWRHIHKKTYAYL